MQCSLIRRRQTKFEHKANIPVLLTTTVPRSPPAEINAVVFVCILHYGHPRVLIINEFSWYCAKLDTIRALFIHEGKNVFCTSRKQSACRKLELWAWWVNCSRFQQAVSFSSFVKRSFTFRQQVALSYCAGFAWCSFKSISCGLQKNLNICQEGKPDIWSFAR